MLAKMTEPSDAVRGRYLGNAEEVMASGSFLPGHGGFLDRVIGGWQLAGFGTYRSRYWSLPTSNWGRLGDIQVYGKEYPVQDCRSGTCIPGYLYWNGYIPANRINPIARKLMEFYPLPNRADPANNFGVRRLSAASAWVRRNTLSAAGSMSWWTVPMPRAWSR